MSTKYYVKSLIATETESDTVSHYDDASEGSKEIDSLSMMQPENAYVLCEVGLDDQENNKMIVYEGVTYLPIGQRHAHMDTLYLFLFIIGGLAVSLLLNHLTEVLYWKWIDWRLGEEEDDVR